MNKMKLFETNKEQELNKKNSVNINLIEKDNLIINDFLLDYEDDELDFNSADITKDIIFSLALSERKTCEAFLKIVLGKENLYINSINPKIITDEMTEQSLDINNEEEVVKAITSLFNKINIIPQQTITNTKFTNKSIRLDIAVTIDNVFYNIEMQCALNDNYPKRVRFYLGMIDTQNHKKGAEKYNDLQDVYIIFISKKDYFQLGYPIYTFTERCYQNPDLEMNDGAVKIFINLSAKREEFNQIKSTFKFPKTIEIKTKTNNKLILKQRDFSEFYGKNNEELEKYYSLLYDLVDVFNGVNKFNKEINENISTIINRIKDVSQERCVIEMETAMSQAFDIATRKGIQIGEQRGIQIGEQRGILFDKIEIIKNFLKFGMTDIKYISNIVNLPEEKVKEIIENNQFNI